MGIPTVSQVFNPFTGVFGNGFVQTFVQSGTWTVPAGISTARVRLWGGGGSNGGCGGGFSLRTIYGLTPGTVIPVVVAQKPTDVTAGSGGTSSFGTYLSATGGGANTTTLTNVGTGIGGDVNTSGGIGGASASGGGGAASLLGNGGNANNPSFYSGASGAGSTNSVNQSGGNGAFSTGGSAYFTNGSPIPPTTGMEAGFTIDLIGTGGGGGANTHAGVNGGGGAYTKPGGFPGGGGGGGSYAGGAGLVIVEW